MNPKLSRLPNLGTRRMIIPSKLVKKLKLKNSLLLNLPLMMLLLAAARKEIEINLLQQHQPTKLQPKLQLRSSLLLNLSQSLQASLLKILKDSSQVFQIHQSPSLSNNNSNKLPHLIRRTKKLKRVTLFLTQILITKI